LTGVTVVTAFDEQGEPRGFTANSFTSVSLDPPLVLVCIAKQAGSFPMFAAADGYAINILSESQQGVSRVFAAPTEDRFSHVEWLTGPAGHPVFEQAAAWLDCRRHELVDAGDHVIMIGRVVGYHHTVQPPLGYSRGTYVSASLERKAAAQGGRSMEIVAILERDEAVLLLGDDEAPLTLPHADRIGGTDDPNSLLGRLYAAGIDAELGFVFAVVDNAETETMRIIYRGTAEPRIEGNSLASPRRADQPNGTDTICEGAGGIPFRHLRRRRGDRPGRRTVVDTQTLVERRHRHRGRRRARGFKPWPVLKEPSGTSPPTRSGPSTTCGT
jgi:flavin reductase (DIM6/NTAB) family NADH-FMN oxidoreductase RutF